MSRAFRLVLASASSARADVLHRAGVPFMTMVSDVDEEAVTAELGSPDPAVLAGELARAKALDVVATILTDTDEESAVPADTSEEPALLVLGCDSVFEFDGEAHGKPGTPEVAEARWRAQAGGTGTLHTGHTLVELPDAAGALPDPQRQVRRTVSAQVSFAEASEAEILDYVATGEPLGCAGGFTLEARGAALVRSVEGDPNAVLGLSVHSLREMLGELGYSLTAVWND
ncbi:MAG: Maf family protein [Micrococcaceae bacterium]